MAAAGGGGGRWWLQHSSIHFDGRQGSNKLFLTLITSPSIVVAVCSSLMFDKGNSFVLQSWC